MLKFVKSTSRFSEIHHLVTIHIKSKKETTGWLKYIQLNTNITFYTRPKSWKLELTITGRQCVVLQRTSRHDGSGFDRQRRFGREFFFCMRIVTTDASTQKGREKYTERVQT